MDWDTIIENSLREFDDFLKNNSWFGRENEVVNLFAHKFLARFLGNPPLKSLSQIGIEVSVKQIQDDAKKKNLVRKDLVIWPEENQTVWNIENDKYNVPAAIIEWKANNPSRCNEDVEWLCIFTQNNMSCLGYSVYANTKDNRGIAFTKVQKGKVVLRKNY